MDKPEGAKVKYTFVVTCELCDTPLELINAEPDGWTAVCGACQTLHQGAYKQ